MATKLLNAATATGGGSAIEARASNMAFQAIGTTSSGAGTAAVDIEGSLDGTNFLVLGTISLTLATTASNDGFATDAPWAHIRANVTSISGTDASVTVYMGAA